MRNRGIKIIFLLLFFCLSFYSGHLLNAEPIQNFNVKEVKPLPPIPSPLKKPTVGEKLIFDVYWFAFHIGTGALEVTEKTQVRGREAYHLVAIAKTNDFLSKIYPVEDEIHSFVDAEGFYALEFKKTLTEKRYHADEHIIFDYPAQKGHYESFWNKSSKDVEIGDKPVLDILSAFYWFRSQEIEVNKSLHALVNSEEKNWDVEFQVLSRQSKSLHAKQRFDTVLMVPKTSLKGILYERGEASIYFTTDEKRTPLVIVLKTPFGSVKGILRN